MASPRPRLRPSPRKHLPLTLEPTDLAVLRHKMNRVGFKSDGKWDLYSSSYPPTCVGGEGGGSLCWRWLQRREIGKFTTLRKRPTLFAKLIKSVFEHTAKIVRREYKARESRFETFYLRVSAEIKYSQAGNCYRAVAARERVIMLRLYFRILIFFTSKRNGSTRFKLFPTN